MPTLSVFCFSDNGRPNRCELIVCFGFDFISLMFSSVENLLTCLLGVCMSSLEKILFSSFAYFKIQIFFFSLLSFMSCLFWKLTLFLIHGLQIPPPTQVLISPNPAQLPRSDKIWHGHSGMARHNKHTAIP